MKTFIFAASVLFSLAHSAFAWDQQENHYKLRLDADMKRAHVEADVWIEGKELAMFNVSGLPGLKNGQAEFIEQLEVRDGSGKLVPWVDKGEGDYELKGDRRLRLQYSVGLEHDKYNWPGGLEEVAYRTDEGLMAVAYYLFLVPGEIKRIVASTEPTDLAPIFARIGLQYEHHLQMLDHYLLPDETASPVAKQRFQSMFGRPAPQLLHSVHITAEIGGRFVLFCLLRQRIFGHV